MPVTVRSFPDSMPTDIPQQTMQNPNVDSSTTKSNNKLIHFECRGDSDSILIRLRLIKPANTFHTYSCHNYNQPRMKSSPYNLSESKTEVLNTKRHTVTTNLTKVNTEPQPTKCEITLTPMCARVVDEKKASGYGVCMNLF